MAKNKEGFIFYPSFYTSIKALKTNKDKLKIFESIAELGLYNKVFEDDMNKTYEEFENFSHKIEQKLEQNNKLLAMFLLIKPQLFANFKKYLNGLKGEKYGYLGAEHGYKGGRPKTPQKPP